jgi:hypothetical protein
MSSTDELELKNQKFIALLREEMPKVTPQIAANLVRRIPREQYIIAARFLNIPNPDSHDTPTLFQAIKTVILGESKAISIEPKDTEGGREESSIKRRKQLSDTMIFVDPNLRKAHQATLVQFPELNEEWERQRRALNPTEGEAFPNVEETKSRASNRPQTSVSPSMSQRARTALGRRNAQEYEKAGGYTNLAPLAVVEQKFPAVIRAEEDPGPLMLAERTTTKKRPTPIPKNDVPIPSTFIPLEAIDFGPQPPTFPEHFGQILTSFQSNLLRPLNIKSLDFATIRLLSDILLSDFSTVRERVDRDIADTIMKIDNARAIMKTMPQPPEWMQNMMTFYVKEYLPALTKYRNILESLFTNRYKMSMGNYLYDVAKSPQLKRCRIHLLNMYGAKLAIAQWQYYALQNRNTLTAADKKEAEDNINRARKAFKDESTSFLIGCYAKEVPQFVE